MIERIFDSDRVERYFLKYCPWVAWPAVATWFVLVFLLSVELGPVLTWFLNLFLVAGIAGLVTHSWFRPAGPRSRRRARNGLEP